ncbi:adenosylmethionine--8-amino-7-oxononanoate transaminase [Rudanella paleaurantiibacter]|uniref:Adenosylmethionine-8-amino-7-oxononanoate aminotransferase n=1 Tax=Rudanella paleaurantiibacter TaxID=2614655 RepID=A0A7J5TSD7_9BACT|nr:adenosylmethionine--8-amino-7-oxononanoate transaminase [Rudanella paleaurantiibacter]KAB7726291.1 adenosylmethionine--8-amino-7-oxononanoate transaminase [Rudanella paleaurantiibacter]
MTLPNRDSAVIWHPFTQMQTAPLPIPIVRGEGSLLFDASGRSFLDMISSWWVNLHGHSHPHIAQRVSEQLNTLEHVIFADFTHEPAVRLAERLLPLLPTNQRRVFYSDNGSTAVEVALKMAFQYWHNLGQPRRRVVAFEDAYHGDTFGAMAVGGRSAFTAPFVPFLFDVEYLPAPTPGREEAVLEQARHLFADDVAAFIFEPLVQGAGGMVMYEPEPIQALIRMARQHGALVIADEVMTGFGRTGKTFACHYLTEQPDLMCLSKGLTGGTMALSVTTCTAAIYEAFLSTDRYKTLFHGHSFTANPVACAASLASLDLLQKPETEQAIARIVQKHQTFADTLRQHPAVENVRQRGTILAFDLRVSGEGSSYFNSIRDVAYRYLLDRGILMRPLGNVLYLLPPYCTTNEQLDEAYSAILGLLDTL